MCTDARSLANMDANSPEVPFDPVKVADAIAARLAEIGQGGLVDVFAAYRAHMELLAVTP